MKKINITMMIFLSAICLMFGMNSVKAFNIDTLPNFKGLQYYSDYYVIIKEPISEYTAQISADKDYYTIIFFNKPKAFATCTDSYIHDLNPYGIDRLFANDSGVSGYSSTRTKAEYFYYYNVDNSNWELKYTNQYNSNSPYDKQYIVYSTIDIYKKGSNANILYYAAGYSLQTEPELLITSSNENSLTTFSIDYSQFLSNSDYRFLYGFHDLAMNDVTNDLVNGVYSGIIDFDDTVIARVVDSNGNTVTETEHKMSYGLKDQYAVYFHNNLGDDFVSFIYSDQEVTEEVIANTPLVNNLLFSGDSGRVAIDFYKESTFETLWNFDGTFCLSRDIDVYIKWSGLIPEYTTNIYAKDEKIWFNINFTRWDSESSDIVIFATETTEISNATSLMNRTYTYGQYTNHTIQDESVFSESVIELKFGYIVDNRPKIFLIRTISVNNLINNLPQATQEEVRLVDEYHKTQLGLNSDNVGFINKFINSIQVPIQAITDLTSYMFGKCNIYIKSFLISIFTIIIIAAIIKFIK